MYVAKGLRTEFVGEAQKYKEAMRSILAGLDRKSIL